MPEDYEYLPWEKHISAPFADEKNFRNKELLDEATHKINSPNLLEFLEHQRQQLEEAKKLDALDERWEFLERCLEKFATEPPLPIESDTARDLIKLGQSIERLRHPSGARRRKEFELMLRANKAEIEAIKRGKFNHMKSGFIAYVQDIAKRLWDNDINNELKLMDVCELLHQQLKDIEHLLDSKSMIPREPSGLKPWLRDVAPNYAKKPGRRRAK